jgi:hypothetical protein
MAADKLQVLRKDKEKFDVFLLPKDLKVFNKDKRDLLLSNYYDEESDQAFIDADTLADNEAKAEQKLQADEDVLTKSKQDSQDNNIEEAAIN